MGVLDIMNPNKSQNKIKKFGIVLSLVFGFLLLSSVDVQAQYGGYGRDDRYGTYGGRNGRNTNEMYRVAQDYGYNDGLRRGAEDMRDRDRYNPEKASDYKKATNGYDSYYGNKDEYKRAYRDAFLRGYDDGFNRYNQNGRTTNGRSGNRNRAIDAIRRVILGF
jgi:hypothetical protein